MRLGGGTAAEADAAVAALIAGGAPAGATDADRAMLTYARKLTMTPGQVNAADVDALRSAGFDSRAIHDICAITAYFAFVNRIADGLGVELEPER